MCAYRDVSGLFTTQLPEDVDLEKLDNDKIMDEPSIVHNIDNEDDLLYGDASNFQMPMPVPKAPEPAVKKQPW